MMSVFLVWSLVKLLSGQIFIANFWNELWHMSWPYDLFFFLSSQVNLAIMQKQLSEMAIGHPRQSGSSSRQNGFSGGVGALGIMNNRLAETSVDRWDKWGQNGFSTVWTEWPSASLIQPSIPTLESRRRWMMHEWQSHIWTGLNVPECSSVRASVSMVINKACFWLSYPSFKDLMHCAVLHTWLQLALHTSVSASV